MSRVGGKPIAIPSGVTVRLDGRHVVAKGPKGESKLSLSNGITAALEGSELRIARGGNGSQDKALHGLDRARCQSLVAGVHEGFAKRMEVVGVSYQAAVEGARLRLQVGFSHPVYLPIPAGLKVECPSATQIHISGVDKQLVGEFAARVRRVRPPEPYKGKGIRYLGEQIALKAGKSFVGGEK